MRSHRRHPLACGPGEWCHRGAAVEPHPGTSDGGPVATTVAVPGELAAAVSALAEALGVGPEALLLAAHARVLAALTAEPEVLAGVAVTDRTLPCRLETGVASWRALVADAAAAVTSLTAADHADEAAALARARRDLAGLWPETVLGLGADLGGSGDGAALAEDTVFRVDRPAGDLLRVVHRPGDLDVAAAERLAGYHLTALGQLCADPDAAPGAAGLVGPEELAFQVDGLAGPERERPALPAHEIIRARAAADPDRVAVVHGDRSWTYRELDEVTDRIARALLARGLPPRGSSRWSPSGRSTGRRACSASSRRAPRTCPWSPTSRLTASPPC